jgi:hypothetical protein
MIQADPNQPRPGIPRDSATDERLGLRVLLGVGVAVVVAVGVWWYWQSGAREPAETPAAVTDDALPQVDLPAEEIRHPIPPPTVGPALQPLPSLDESDPRVGEELLALVGPEATSGLFVANELARRFVAAVDNLPRRQLPLAQRPVQAAPGTFIVGEQDGVPVLDTANYARYAPFVRLAGTLDAAAAVAAYQRLYPLFQQSYEQLGYPDRYFNDRLIAAIDDLLAAPEIEGAVQLTRPNVLYEFADPTLEARSAGQKIMIRIGPANARLLKAKLRELRALLATG